MVRVLVVDDTAFMRFMMRTILEELGFEVVAEARNGVISAWTVNYAGLMRLFLIGA
jgi:two-component system chemotaxis response regulator CheY